MSQGGDKIVGITTAVIIIVVIFVIGVAIAAEMFKGI
jgi:hypothetical protein